MEQNLGTRSSAIPLSLYEPAVQLCFKDFISQGDCVLDVGANSGWHAVMLSSLVGARGSVHCFEPNPRVGEQLRNELEANGCANVRHVEKAAWSESGKRLRLYLDSDPGGQASSLIKDVSDQSLEVETVSLGDYCEALGLSPSLVKVDVEGAEWEALTGLESLLGACPPIIVIESSAGRQPDPLERLSTLGYGIFELGLFRQVVPGEAFRDAPPVGNFLAVPTSIMKDRLPPQLGSEVRAGAASGRDESWPVTLPPGRYVCTAEVESAGALLAIGVLHAGSGRALSYVEGPGRLLISGSRVHLAFELAESSDVICRLTREQENLLQGAVYRRLTGWKLR